MIWIPNLLTGMNLFLGFWAIIQAIEGNFLMACWLIIAASVCDGLDGKIARFFHRTSEMGVELDSLADAVSFGAAPGVLLYQIFYHNLGFLGVFLASLPLLFGVIRLARFNLTAATGEKKSLFVGLPIPMAANTVATFIIFNYAAWGTLQLDFLLIPLTAVLCLLMVSHAPYDSLPKLSVKETLRKPLRLIVLAALITGLAIKPALAFFPLIILYILRGIVMGLLHLGAEEEEELDTELEIK